MLNHIKFIKRKVKLFLQSISIVIKVNLSKGQINVFDVGSQGKLFSPLDEYINEINYLIRFDPFEENLSKIGKCITYNYALWNENKIKEFYIYKGLNNTGSSFKKQNVEYVSNNYKEISKHGNLKLNSTWFERSTLEKSIPIKCKTIDEILSKKKCVIPDLLKIDVQGGEYEVLEGCKTNISKITAIHLETFIMPLYKEIKLQKELIFYLEKKGFELVLKFDSHGSFNSQEDCLFINKKLKNTKTGKSILRIYGK